MIHVDINRWPGLSGSATASPATVVSFLPRCRYEKVLSATTATRLGYVEVLARGRRRTG